MWRKMTPDSRTKYALQIVLLQILSEELPAKPLTHMLNDSFRIAKAVTKSERDIKYV